MKSRKTILMLILLGCTTFTLQAQPQKSRVQRNRATTTQNGKSTTNFSRAELMFPKSVEVPADVVWRRDIYRTIDLTDGTNAALYYPLTPQVGQVNLFTLLFQLVNQGKLPVYRYNTDGLENFSKENRMHFKDMLDRYNIPYEIAGNTIRVDAVDIPSSEVLSYYVKESAYYDQNTATYNSRVTAFCPVLHRADEFSVDPVKYPLFWVKYDDVATYLAAHTLMVSDLNNAARMSMADFFDSNRYHGKIYMTTNMQGKTLQEYCPTDSLLSGEQARIEKEIKDFELHLWHEPIDSVALAKQDSIDAAQNTKKSRRTSRRSSSSASKSSKSSKSNSASSGPRVSVRRQRH